MSKLTVHGAVPADSGIGRAGEVQIGGSVDGGVEVSLDSKAVLASQTVQRIEEKMGGRGISEGIAYGCKTQIIANGSGAYSIFVYLGASELPVRFEILSDGRVLGNSSQHARLAAMSGLPGENGIELVHDLLGGMDVNEKKSIELNNARSASIEAARASTKRAAGAFIVPEPEFEYGPDRGTFFGA